jgi:ABC-type glutathione transport system ATPase component
VHEPGSGHPLAPAAGCILWLLDGKARNDPTPLTAPVVAIEDLNIQFTGGKKPVQAVSGVSLSVRPGEAVALIGESGSGKSVTLRTLLRLHPERKTTMKGKVRWPATMCWP